MWNKTSYWQNFFIKWPCWKSYSINGTCYERAVIVTWVFQHMFCLKIEQSSLWRKHKSVLIVYIPCNEIKVHNFLFFLSVKTHSTREDSFHLDGDTFLSCDMDWKRCDLLRIDRPWAIQTARKGVASCVVDFSHLAAMVWHRFVVSICISLMITDIEHFFICVLDICI